MKINTDITKNKKLIITVDTENPNVTISSIDIFNCCALKEQQPCYSQNINASYAHLELYENEINCYSEILDGKPIDLLNDLVVICIHLEYAINEQTIDTPCNQMPECIWTGCYYKCGIYTRIMNAMKDINDDCTNLNDSEFVDEAGRFDVACKRWGKFQSTKTVQVSKGCGCHG